MKSSKSILQATIALAIIIVLITVSPSLTALADAAGPNNPSSGTNRTGIGTDPWLNPENITAPGSPYASVTLPHDHLITNYLQGTAFGFAIPAGASISGIEVKINRMSDGHNPNIVDSEIRLVKGGEIIGENRAITTTWPTTFTMVTYGGPTDLWGTTWLADDVNAANFGVVLAAHRDNNGNKTRQAIVDSMQITVYFGFTSSTSVACGDGSPITYGDSVICTATVTRSSGIETPNGVVNWTSSGSGNFAPNPCILEGADGISSCTATYTPSVVGTGSHLVTASYPGDTVFAPSSASQSVAVLQRPVTVTADPKTKVFGALDPALTYQITAGSLVIGDNFTGSLSRAPGENVGQYAILQGSLALSINYNLSYVGNYLTITKANPTCTIVGWSGVYDGNAHGATGSCTGVNGETLQGLNLGNSFTNVPGGTANWSFTDVTGNYNNANGSVQIVIAKADPTCTINGFNGTYDGNAHGATGECTGVTGGALEGLNLGASYTNVPGGSANWVFTDITGNYNNDSGSVNIVIGQAEPNCSIVGFNGVYDRNPHGASGACTGVAGEPLEGLNLGSSFTNVPGGTANWVFTSTNGNYSSDSGSVAIVISKAEAVCTISGYTGVYDAAYHGATGACSGLGGENPGTLNLGDTFKDVPGGTANWTFTGNGNYNNQAGQAPIVISQAVAVCNISGYTGIYDGAYHGASGSCSGIGGENPGTLDLGDTFKDFPGGTANWVFTGNGNYADQTGDAAIVINKAEAICDISGFTGVYDAAYHGATGSCTGIGGENPGVLDLGETYKDAPGGTAHWVLTGNGNYTDQAGDVAIAISKAEAVCDITGYSGVYDGAEHGASGTCSGISGEPPGTLDLGATYKDVPGGAANWMLTGNGNYNDQNGEVPIVISKATALCVITPYIVEYDRLAHTATGGCTGVLGEELTGLDLSATTHAEVGDYPNDSWIFTDVSGNYNDATGTVSDQITLRYITVTADDKYKFYGQADPIFTYQITGGSLLEGDFFTGKLTRVPGESLGTYSILEGTLSLPSYYSINFVRADLVILVPAIYLPMIRR